MTNDLIFHSDFSTATSDPGCVILQSNDNTHFYYPLPVLAKVSDLFRDLSELDRLSVPLPTSSSTFPEAVDSKIKDQEYPLIPLPSAKAKGLSYALHFINGAVDGTPLPVLDRVSARTVMPALLDIAKAYQIPSLLPAMAIAYAVDNLADPFGAFALFAISGDEGRAQSASKSTLGMSILDVPDWALTSLKEMAPQYLLRLYRLHLARPAALAKLKSIVERKSISSIEYIVTNHSKNVHGGRSCAVREHYSDLRSVSNSNSVIGQELSYDELFSSPFLQAVDDEWQDAWLIAKSSADLKVEFEAPCEACKSMVSIMWRSLLYELLADLKPTI